MTTLGSDPSVIPAITPSIAVPVPADASLPATHPLPGATAAAQPRERRKLAVPAAVNTKKVRWHVAITIAAIHLLAMLAFIPYLFSWSGVALVPIGLYLFGILGINACYHRLLTHKSYSCPRWVEYGLTFLALCNLQGMPTSWVAAHRRHHQHSDDQPDPHSPLVTFFWGHVGWLLVENADVDTKEGMEHFTKDLRKQWFYRSLQDNRWWLLFYPFHALVISLLGAGFGYWMSGTSDAALQMGLSWLVWGVFVRLVVVWHVTWSVNSIAHTFGYRNYETDEESRNNWFVAIFSGGEGWHNNHHGDQRSAAHGHKWWEFDLTYQSIRVLRALGLAWDLVQPREWGKERKV